MVNVVITGSSKGIGKGYAREFLKRGHNVLVTGRSQDGIDEALEDIRKDAKDGARAAGHICIVSDMDSLQSTWDKAVAEFGSVDIWINNAGRARTGVTLLELTPDEINEMIDSNVIGTMKASQVALRGMKTQGHGFIYNTLGAGADGRVLPGMIGYGTTKRAVNYFSTSLINETKDTDIKVGTISPGTNITEGMIREVKSLPPEQRNKMIKPLNFLGDHVSTTTPWIVDQILANTETGKNIKWMTTGKLLGRAVSGLFKKRDVFGQYDIA